MRRSMRFRAAVGTFAATIAVAPGSAVADTTGSAPAGGGLPALEVRVDLAGGAVLANGARTPISLERSQLPDENGVIVEPIAIGQGKHVVHVRVPAKGDATGGAWEAILSAGRAAPI